MCVAEFAGMDGPGMGGVPEGCMVVLFAAGNFAANTPPAAAVWEMEIVNNILRLWRRAFFFKKLTWGVSATTTIAFRLHDGS